MKYYIIPNFEAIETEAVNKETAIVDFATNMDSDMNTYFKVVTEEELANIREDRDWEGRRRIILDSMAESLMNIHDVEEIDAKNLSTVCYDMYCKGDLSEQDAVIETFTSTKDSELNALESMCLQYESAKDFHGEIEVAISDDRQLIHIRRYVEEDDQAYDITNIRRSCLSYDDISELCKKHGWYSA